MSKLTSIVAAGVLASMALVSGPVQAKNSFKPWLECRSTELVKFPGTIVDAAIATPELSTLTSLVVAANLTGPLSGKGPFTVFAPTNDAFAKVPAALLGVIGSDVNLLTTVLTYHVAPDSIDPRKSLLTRQAKTLQGQTLYVGYSGKGVSVNQSVANCKGVQTTNGTVWFIDSVLLPQFK